MATADRSDPFDQLLRSHRRLEERLADLPAAAADLAGARNAEALTYIKDTLSWMSRAVVRHEEDEERSLFPRLKGHVEIEALIRKLSDEHRLHEKLQAELADAAGKDPARARTLVAELSAAYATHIKEEESQLFPAARTLLTPADLEQINVEMANRRGR